MADTNTQGTAGDVTKDTNNSSTGNTNADPTSANTTVSTENIDDSLLGSAKTEEDKTLSPNADDKNKEPEKQDDKAKTGAPESYEDFKLPEGITLNSELANEFKSIAKEEGLTQTQAQRLVDLQCKYASQQQKQIDDTFRSEVAEWKKETIKELGVDAPKKLALAAKAMDTFAPQEIREILNTTGLGSHKAFVNFFINIGEKINGDTFVHGNSGRERTDAEIFYPNMKKNNS